jgi:transposase InsO family protein
VKFAFVHHHRGEFPVGLLCEVLGVSRAGYYAWRRRPPSARADRRGRLVGAIREAHAEGRAAYGSPRVYRALKARGVACCVNTVAKLMREHGIRSEERRRPVVRTTDSRHGRPAAANVLAREFRPERPDAAWAADITYIPTAEGWLYLAAVIDLYSRRVVGWAIADHLRAELPLAALHMALAARRPAAGLVHHSDRGSQYACEAYRAVLAAHEVEPGPAPTNLLIRQGLA